MKAKKIPRTYRMAPEILAMMPDLRGYIENKISLTVDETAIIEYALRELAKVAKIKPPKIGPGKCSECGNLAIEGTFFCPQHMQDK